MSVRNDLVNELIAASNQSDAVFLQRFFKTGPGEYGEGDRFLGLRVPQTRAIARKYYQEVSHSDIEKLLGDKWHEVRQAALFIMLLQYPKSSNQQALYELYLNQIGRGINNWDLVDVTSPRIVGAYLSDKDKLPLYELVKGGLWQKRVAIISTFYFLSYQQNPIDTYQLAEIMVNEQHDLLQKAVGWALREMGKVDSPLLYQFLDKHAATMPRTMLRYSLEKLSDQMRRKYMSAKDTKG